MYTIIVVKCIYPNVCLSGESEHKIYSLVSSKLGIALAANTIAA